MENNPEAMNAYMSGAAPQTNTDGAWAYVAAAPLSRPLFLFHSPFFFLCFSPHFPSPSFPFLFLLEVWRWRIRSRCNKSSSFILHRLRAAVPTVILDIFLLFSPFPLFFPLLFFPSPRFNPPPFVNTDYCRDAVADARIHACICTAPNVVASSSNTALLPTL